MQVEGPILFRHPQERLVGRGRSPANAIYMNCSCRWIWVRAEAHGVYARWQKHALLLTDDLVCSVDALAVVQDDKIKLPEHLEIISIVRNLSRPGLINQTNGLAASRPPVG